MKQGIALVAHGSRDPEWSRPFERLSAALEKFLADEIIAEATTTTVPADYFDGLLAALDEPAQAPRLAQAAKRARRSPRISAR